MKRRFLCGLSAATSLLLAICANAVTTTKNIDVVVTHSSGSGAVIKSLDYYLPSIVGGASPGAYAPLVVGQVFRAGDVPSGFHVVVTNASGNPLQWQEDMIAPVWNDPNNSSLNGSMRHGVFSVLVPAAGTGNTTGRIQSKLVSGAPT